MSLKLDRETLCKLTTKQAAHAVAGSGIYYNDDGTSWCFAAKTTKIDLASDDGYGYRNDTVMC